MKKKIIQLAVLMTVGVFLPACGGAAATDKMNTESETQTETTIEMPAETVSPVEVVTADMVPVYGKDIKDGIYFVKAEASSSMFKITNAELKVNHGTMSAVITMSGTGYGKLFMGTGEEAEKASEAEWIPYVETADGSYTFEIPVEALDMGIDCAAFSKKKEKWYDRVLVFRADSIPADAFSEGMIATVESLQLEDGEYTIEVLLGGGSGKASVESPAELRIEGGKAYATIIWGSRNYDYMKVNDEQYELINTEGNSTFEIPITGFDCKMPVVADTIAMSTPHEIEYTMIFDSTTLKKAGTKQEADNQEDAGHRIWENMRPVSNMQLSYANQFSIDNYEGGYALISVEESGQYLVVPEQAEVPENLPGNIEVLRKPFSNIYLAATSAMDLFRSLDGIKTITLSGTDSAGWYIKEAKDAMEAGAMSYAGKYNAPDYELILSMQCDLAIESTMINHSPEVKEKLQKLGIPVLVERSSYETHPFGRMEWIKLYGVLLGKEHQAEMYFNQQMKQLEPVLAQKNTGKTAAFFYIGSNGSVNVRKASDYVAKMIEMAGGIYIPQNMQKEENALSTMNMQMEAFYAAAKDADILIYNSAIDGELQTVDELLAKNSLLADFKAVKEGNVWCTEKNLFQETMGLGDMMLDIHNIFTMEHANSGDMTYMHKLH